MAEQEVRPQQLSIVEIARLWSAETGDSAEDVERELASWAYAAAADGAQVGLEPSSDSKSPATLKIEPDPRRELCWDDLEAFCRDRDRLPPHFWPEASAPSGGGQPPGEKLSAAAPETSGQGEPETEPRDMSRLVVRAMNRMGSSAFAPAASRRAPHHSEPPRPPKTADPEGLVKTDVAVAEKPAAVKKLTVKKPAVKKSVVKKPIVQKPTSDSGQSEKMAAPPAGATTQPPASTEDLDGPRRRPSPTAKPAPVAKVIRAAKKRPVTSGENRALDQKSKFGPMRDIASRAQDVPVKVMGSSPALTTARLPRSAPLQLSLIAAAGVLGGALIAAAGGAAWLELKGPGLESFLRGERVGQAELAEMEKRVAESSTRAAKAVEEKDRLTNQLNLARRQNGTLRTRIDDISSLGPRLTEVQKSNRDLRRTVGDLTTALDTARSGGSAAVLAIEEEMKSARQALNKANTATLAAQNNADRLTSSLATAQGEIEAGMLARLRLEQERDSGKKALTAAKDEIENLSQSGVVAKAVAQRLEKELGTSKLQLETREKEQIKLQGQLTALNEDLAGAHARAAQLAAAETESRRLGAALDAAKLEVAELRSAAKSDKKEAAGLAARLDQERQKTAQVRTGVEASREKNQKLAKDLALSQMANAELRAETDGINTQAAQLTEFLATAREDAKTLETERDSAIAKTKGLERDLASVKDESATLRASLEGTHGTSAQLAARLATAEKRVAKQVELRGETVARADALAKELETTKAATAKLRASLEGTNDASAQLAARLATAEKRVAKQAELRGETVARADALAKELKTAKAAAAKQDAARIAAKNRVESLVVSMAAAKAEVLKLRDQAKQADEKAIQLLEATDKLKAEAKLPAVNLTAAKGRPAVTAASDIRPQSGPPKETLIGAVANTSPDQQKLDTSSQVASVGKSVLKNDKGNESAKLMLARGNEYLGLGDIASARLFFEQAAEQGDTAALTAVGRTYDPRVLKGLGVLGSFANPAIATQWYERALSAGDAEANQQLEALRAWQNP